MNALLLPKSLIALTAGAAVVLAVGVRLAQSQPGAAEDLRLDADIPPAAAVEQAQAAGVKVAAADPAAGFAAGPEAAQPEQGERLSIASVVDSVEVGFPAPVASDPVEIYAPATDDWSLAMPAIDPDGADRLLIAMKEMQEKFERELQRKESQLDEIAREFESALLPQYAVRNQLDIEQIGRLQEEILALKRRIREEDQQATDARREKWNAALESLTKEVDELTEEVARRSEADPDLHGRRRQVEDLRAKRRAMAQRIGRMEVERQLRRALQPPEAKKPKTLPPKAQPPKTEQPATR